MKVLAFLFLFLAQSALAYTYTYEVYSNNEKQDFLVEIEFSGRFQSTSDLLTFRVWGIQNTGRVILFDLDHEQVKENLNLKWLTTKTLVIGSKIPFQSVVRKPFNSITGNSPIVQDQDYKLHNYRMNIDGTVGEDVLHIENYNYGEKSVKGSLRRKN